MTKSKLREIIIAVAIGAAINFLTKILDMMLQMQTSDIQQLTAAGGGGIIYLIRNFKS